MARLRAAMLAMLCPRDELIVAWWQESCAVRAPCAVREMFGSFVSPTLGTTFGTGKGNRHDLCSE
jgi:hypothetical protein